MGLFVGQKIAGQKIVGQKRQRARMVASITLLGCLVLVPADAGATGSDWLEVKSPHFTLYTDAGARQGRAVSHQLEQFRSVFARLAPSLELQSPAPTTLFAFKDSASYGPFKAGSDRRGARILGQFSRTRDGNYLTLDVSAAAGGIGVIYHEYVHFLVLNNFHQVPLWFNEGLAEYYSTFELDEDRATLGLPVERHVRWLRDDLDFSLDELVYVDSAAASEHDAEELGRFYALSWLLVHYLLSGGDEEIDGIVDYFDRLQDGEDAERAFERSFGRRMSTMADELRTYLAAGTFPSRTVRVRGAGAGNAQVRPMARADVLFQLGDLSAHLGKTSQAEALFHQALEKRAEHGDALAGLAALRDQSQRLNEAEVLFQDALAAGPTRAVSFLNLARHSLTLAQGGAKEPELQAARARRALDKVLAQMPSFAEALSLKGVAEALPGGDFDAALGAITKARRLMPARQDWLARHIQILLNGDRLGAAEKMLRDQLEPVSEDYELVSQLWQAIDRAHLLKKSREAFAAGDVEEGLRAFDEMVSLATDPALRAQLEAQLEDLRRQAESMERP